jgi:hypothetical protein
MKKLMTIVTLCVLAMGMISCGKALDTGQTTIDEMEMTERNQERLLKSTPPPEMKNSLERENLVKYLKEINREDRISYIYLISYGKVMAFHTVKGKVTYCSSKLTTRDQVVEVGDGSTGAGRTRHTMESPGLDGSYGPSEDAIFFWTTEEVLVQWRGDYMWLTEPLQLSTPPAMVRMIEDK